MIFLWNNSEEIFKEFVIQLANEIGRGVDKGGSVQMLKTASELLVHPLKCVVFAAAPFSLTAIIIKKMLSGSCHPLPLSTAVSYCGWILESLLS